MQENNYKTVCAMINNPFDVIQINAVGLPRSDFALIEKEVITNWCKYQNLLTGKI